MVVDSTGYQFSGKSNVAWPVASVNVFQGTTGGATGSLLVELVGVAEAMAEGLADAVAVGLDVTTVFAGTGAPFKEPRFAVTSTPAVTAAAAIVNNPATRITRWRRVSAIERTFGGNLSAVSPRSVTMRRSTASASGIALRSVVSGSVPDIKFLMGSISSPHFL
ncbi:hypothetical protein AB6813_04365 [bacterium RCC_150]